MNTKTMFCAVLSILVMPVAASVTAHAQDQTNPQSQTTTQPPAVAGDSAATPALRLGCRNARYGELLVVKGPALKLRAIIYNTLGLNDCPPDQWKQLDADQIKKQEHSLGVRPDGPRYFLMDSIALDKTDETKTFGGIPMQQVAQIKLNPSTAREKLQVKPYDETTVAPNVQYVFDQDKPMYELTSPKGQVYVMLSYTQTVDKTLTMDQLPGLGGKLKLPAGWHYRVITPDHDVVIPASKKGVNVLQDELMDTYQRLDAPASGAS